MDAQHEFADQDYVRKWAASADQRRPERRPMFRRLVELLHALPEKPRCVVELGCGPGTLAETILDALPEACYVALDFSTPMLELARERLQRFGGRARVEHADLRGAEWLVQMPPNVDAIVSNQALHDLGSAEDVEAMYRRAFGLLRPGGLFVNAELTIAEGTTAGKAGKLTVPHHLELLRRAGFSAVRSDLAFGDYVALVGERTTTAG